MRTIAKLGTATVLLMSLSGYAMAASVSGATHAAGNAAANATSGIAGASGSAGAGVSGNTNGKSTMVAGSANANGGVSADTYGAVISNLRTDAASSMDLSSTTSESDISIIKLSDLKGQGAENAKALDKAIAANQSTEAALQTKIASNDAITAKLSADNLTAQDVVAVKTSADGSVTLYVDDRS